MKNKKTTIILISSLFTLVIAALVYNYVFYSEHRNIAEEEAAIVLTATDVHAQFLKDESLATTNYLDKVMETSGIITSVEINAVILNNQLHVIFNSDKPLKLENGTSLAIKGRCVGYDELLEMVKIDQAIIIK